MTDVSSPAGAGASPHAAGSASAGVAISPRAAVLEQLVSLGGPDWRHCSHCLDVAGVPLHFIEQGRGPAVVLLHGFGAWAYSWRHNVPALASAYRVIVPDLKGFGLSGRDRRQGHSLDDQARFVLNLLDQLGIDRAVWIGNSMGGEISLRAALQAPDRVAGLGLICTSGTFRIRHLRWLQWATRLPGFAGWLARRLGTLETVSRTLLGALGDPSRYRDDDAHAYWLPFTLPGLDHVIAALARDADFGATADRLHEVKPPTLLLWGENDNYIPLAHAKKMAAVLPDSRLVVLPGVGHAPQEEAPEQVNRLLHDFLAGLGPEW